MPTPELARNLYEETGLERDKWHKRALAAERQLDERAEEIAALKEALECERATWRRHWKERDQAALAAERQLAEAQDELGEQRRLAAKHLAYAAECNARAEAAERQLAEAREAFSIGEQVEKFTGDYQIPGEVRAVFRTRAGKVRYVVEHEPGFLHIYSQANLRHVRTALQDRAPAGIHGVQPSLMVLEQSETTDGLQALTIRWPGGKETVELMSLRVADALQDRVPSEQDGGRNDR